MWLRYLLCARPDLGGSALVVPVWPLSLCALASASPPAFLAMLSTWQACAPSGPMPAPFPSLDHFFPGLYMTLSFPPSCAAQMPLLPCSPSPQLLTASKPRPLPSLPLLSRHRTQCHLPPVFYFSTFFIVVSYKPTAVPLRPVAIGSGQQVLSTYSGWVCGLSCVLPDTLCSSCSGNCAHLQVRLQSLQRCQRSSCIERELGSRAVL